MRRRRDFWIFQSGIWGIYFFCPFLLFEWVIYKKDYVSHSWWSGFRLGILPSLSKIAGNEVKFRWFFSLITDRILYRDIFLETGNGV